MSQQPQEAPLSTDELETRVAALWRGELEWVRQHPNPDLSMFDAEFEKELSRTEIHELPALDIAMWPKDLNFNIDTSDPGKFNDRFIEIPAKCSSSAVLLLISIHHVVLMFILALAVFTGASPVEFAPLYLFALLILAPLTYYAIKSNKLSAGRIRYNRQAQLIHIDNGQGRIAHIPWRHIRPAVDNRYGPMGALQLYAPHPHAAIESNKLRTSGNPHPSYLMEPYTCGSGIEGLYDLQRLEFLRRYMEHGIKAVQPQPGTITPQQKATYSRHRLSPLLRVWHWLCFIPLLDRYMRHGAENAEWSDEVQNLCGPAPDLRGLDTRPVKSRTDIYYRPAYDHPVSFGYRLVNRHGHPLPQPAQSLSKRK